MHAPVVVLQPSVVHRSLSLQFLGVFTQPVAELQLSAVQAFLSLQSSLPVPAVQLPWAQTSPVVHLSPSSQAAVLKELMHAPVFGLHASVVQTLLSLQLFGVPDAHLPAPSH